MMVADRGEKAQQAGVGLFVVQCAREFRQDPTSLQTMLLKLTRKGH